MNNKKNKKENCDMRLEEEMTKPRKKSTKKKRITKTRKKPSRKVKKKRPKF